MPRPATRLAPAAASFTCLVALVMVLTARPAGAGPDAFLELFTSQGCSSCPPADKLLKVLDARDNVVAVTMPVTIWDFLGWNDTLAREAFTKRQIAYSVARGDRDVYTPQLVVNGVKAVVGSDRDAIDHAIAETADRMTLPISLSVADGVMTVSVSGATGVQDKATLWLLVADEHVEVPVGNGENHGRTLAYHNVVRHMRPIGMWKGKPVTFDLPLSDVEKRSDGRGIVIAQVETFKGPGPVIGAATVDRLFPARTIADR